MSPSPRARILSALAVGSAAAVLSGCSALNALTGGVERDDEGNVTTGNEHADVFEVTVGDCLATLSSGAVSRVPIVPCSEVHEAEAYASHLMGDGDFPGDEAVFAAADEACLAEFDDFIGLPYEESLIELTYYHPTAASWADGDREILCLATDPAGPTTGSLVGAQR